jgi:hypothetical protein
MQSIERQDNILQQLKKIQADNDDRKTQIDEMPKKRKGFGSTVVGYLASRPDQSESAALEADLRDALLGAVYDRKPPALNVVDDMDSKLNVTSDTSSALRRQLLSSLHYDEMADRVGTVSDAHDSTFRWIFDEPEEEQSWANLGRWLESEDQLYWITGKAGSGKSTLMKFISQPRTQGQAPDEPAEARCLQHLRKWSDGQPLAVASFYFWAAGTKLQTSKAGLYRTLLCQILEDHTDVIPLVFPERWEALCLFNEDPKIFTEDELQHSLTRALLLLAKTTKMCLFVDGLDEFDGDHGNLIELLTRIIDGTSIKICVASRPWVVFEEALQNKPSLRLEDFTFNDIKEYVTSRFQADSNFKLLWRREFEFADRLVERVVRKAAGVFLWVNLVVSSLLNGMKHGDRISDLQRRLDSLPPDLEDLYERILDNLDPFYFEHAAQYFSLMGACQEPPSALLFSLADEDKPNFSLQLQATLWTDSDFLESRIDMMQRRLNSRCKGLMEIGRPPAHGTTQSLLRNPTVQYLHKTVKDYIEKPDVLRRLQEGLQGPFDPHLRLCAANLGMVKVQFEFHDQDRLDSLSRQVAQCMRHAARVLPRNVPVMLQVLDQLESHLNTTGFTGLFSSGQPLSRIALFQRSSPSADEGDPAEEDPSVLEYFGNSFLSLAVKCEVVEYVKARAGRLEVKQLDQAAPRNPAHRLSPKRIPWRRLIRPWSRSNAKTLREYKPWAPKEQRQYDLDALLSSAIPSPSPNIPLITFLLEKGADPNADATEEIAEPYSIAPRITTWARVMATLMSVFADPTLDPGREAVWLETVRLLLVHGAQISDGDWVIEVVIRLFTANFIIPNNLTFAAGMKLLHSTLQDYERGRGPLQLDFLSGILLNARRIVNSMGGREFIVELE